MNVGPMPSAAQVHPTEPASIVVHKYRCLTDFFWQGLERSELYFAAPNQLNDPYDCQIDLMKAFVLARGDEKEAKAWRPHAEKIMELSATTGILSFSVGDLTDSSLMWTHYGGNHAGVCLTYEIPESFVLSTLVGQAPVHYGDDVLIQAIQQLDFGSRLTYEALEPVIKAYLTTKAEAWRYEQEGRLLAMNASAIVVPRDWLKQVCFGLRTPTDHRQQVTDALVRWGYHACGRVELVHSLKGVFDLVLRPA